MTTKHPVNNKTKYHHHQVLLLQRGRGADFWYATRALQGEVITWPALLQHQSLQKDKSMLSTRTNSIEVNEGAALRPDTGAGFLLLKQCRDMVAWQPAAVSAHQHHVLTLCV